MDVRALALCLFLRSWGGCGAGGSAPSTPCGAWSSCSWWRSSSPVSH